MSRLRSLFIVIGVTAGGLLLLMLAPDATPADALDAGLLDVSTPARVECRFYVHPDCRNITLPDAPLPAYMTAQVRARFIDGGFDGDGGSTLVLADMPNRPDGGFCIIPVGSIAEACTVLEVGSCSPLAVCSYEYPTQGLEAGACYRPDAGRCRIAQSDGGFIDAPMGVTLAPNSWVGPGCFRKYPGPVVFAEGDESWPEECPQ
jgi:hypothetical protein